MPVMIGSEGIFNMNEHSKNESETVVVHRIGIGDITVYSVKLEELEALEQGGERIKSLVNWITFSLSIAIASLFTVLATKEFKFDWLEPVYWCLFCAFGLFTVYLHRDQRKYASSNKELADSIRNRQKTNANPEYKESQSENKK